MSIFSLGDKILSLLVTVFNFWNEQVAVVFGLLCQSPAEFKGGTPWAMIEDIEPVFVAIGTSLVTLFFVIGFCSESVEIRQEMRFEVILRMLIRIGLSEWLVINHLSIMKTIFDSVGALVRMIGIKNVQPLTIDIEQAKIIYDLGFGESLIFLILSALLSLVIIICGFFLIYTVYFRFLKIMVIVPFAALAFSTMSGNRNVAHSALTYAKYFISILLEAVAMALAIMVCNSFINAGLPEFMSGYSDWTQTLIYLCEMTFTIALTVGAVKGSQQLVSKALGL